VQNQHNIFKLLQYIVIVNPFSNRFDPYKHG